ncbi:MAG TPA: DUF1836 domain-containing protein [Bacillota bacterium]|nr:DUF1836 domain-containing protein [Bacillota bacterium]
MSNLIAIGKYIPGTVILREEINGTTGLEFLDRIFFVTDGIMLSQIREIAGVDGSTLQNWVKRGWVGNAKNKRYSKDQLARILIINMLRSSMQLENIDFLLRYINGTIDDATDDIIPESMLYEYVCRIIDRIAPTGGPCNMTREELRKVIAEQTSDYEDKVEGASVRLRAALEIIIIAYFASLLTAYSAELYGSLNKE